MPSQRHAIVVLKTPTFAGSLDVPLDLAGSEPPEQLALKARGNKVYLETLPVPVVGLAF